MGCRVLSQPGEPDEDAEQEHDAGAKQKGVVQGEDARLLPDHSRDVTPRHQFGHAQALQLLGQSRKRVQRGVAPSTEIIGQTELMPWRAPKINHALKGDANGAPTSRKSRNSSAARL